jgi:hypothetical protein
MNDIVERIRKLRFVHIPGTSDLMEEACQEIERLRQFDRLQPIEPADATPATHATPGDGSVQSEGTVAPAAWLAVAADGSESSAVYMLKEQADAAAREWGWFVVPLYRSPTLTDEEREVVEIAAAYMSATGCRNTNVQATLHSLLARLS